MKNIKGKSENTKIPFMVEIYFLLPLFSFTIYVWLPDI